MLASGSILTSDHFASAQYTPALTAATTNPDLGASGEANGQWVRIGDLIVGWAQFLFSGSGVDNGEGTYFISLPVPAASSMAASGSQGAGSVLGSAVVRFGSTDPSGGGITAQLTSGGTNMVLSQVVGELGRLVAHHRPAEWSDGDRITVQFCYLAEGL